MKVALLVPGFNYPGDAVGNDVHGMYANLRDAGIACGVFCHSPHGRPDIAGGSFHDALEWLTADDLVVYHYVGGDQLGLDTLRAVGCQVILRYHNVTPSHFFAGISDEFVTSCEEGKRQLADFLKLPRVTACSASSYSAAELVSTGLPAARSLVLPPFHMTNELQEAARAHSRHDAAQAHKQLLYVGRVAPHKGIETLLSVLATLVERTKSSMTLTIVGGRDARLERYFDKLSSTIKEHRIEESVRFRHDLTVAELARCYASADVFVTCSEHEGFCVPVIEAMALGVPVVARNSTALPETVGSAGILCSDHADFVHAIEKLISDKHARDELSARGRQRYEEQFDTGRIGAAFKALLQTTAHPETAPPPRKPVPWWRRWTWRG